MYESILLNMLLPAKVYFIKNALKPEANSTRWGEGADKKFSFPFLSESKMLKHKMTNWVSLEYCLSTIKKTTSIRPWQCLKVQNIRLHVWLIPAVLQKAYATFRNTALGEIQHLSSK